MPRRCLRARAWSGSCSELGEAYPSRGVWGCLPGQPGAGEWEAGSWQLGEGLGGTGRGDKGRAPGGPFAAVRLRSRQFVLPVSDGAWHHVLGFGWDLDARVP